MKEKGEPTVKLEQPYEFACQEQDNDPTMRHYFDDILSTEYGRTNFQKLIAIENMRLDGASSEEWAAALNDYWKWVDENAVRPSEDDDDDYDATPF